MFCAIMLRKLTNIFLLSFALIFLLCPAVAHNNRDRYWTRRIIIPPSLRMTRDRMPPLTIDFPKWNEVGRPSFSADMARDTLPLVAPDLPASVDALPTMTVEGSIPRKFKSYHAAEVTRSRAFTPLIVSRDSPWTVTRCLMNVTLASLGEVTGYFDM